jgi:hypothetical protein
MSLIEQGRSFLEALKQGLDAGSKTEVPNVPPEVLPKVPSELKEQEKSSWELLLESKLANTKQKKNKKVKRDNMNASLIMKSPVEKQRTNASESETSKTSRSINKRESTPRTKRPAAGDKCLSSFDCKGVTSGSYRCTSCKFR